MASEKRPGHEVPSRGRGTQRRTVRVFRALPLGAWLAPRGKSTKSAASSASLRSVLRGVPINARMVRLRAKSVTWLARTATGKSDGISPAVIPSRRRRSTIATAPAAAFCRNCRTSASSTSGATHSIRQPTAEPSSVALSTACLRKLAIEARRVCGERSAFAARAPFFSAYALRTRRNNIRLSPKTAYRLGRDEIVDRHAVVAFRPENLDRLLQRLLLIEAARSPTRPGGILKHLVQKLLDHDHRPQYITEQFETSKPARASRGLTTRPCPSPRSHP